jgi:thioredoxin 1
MSKYGGEVNESDFDEMVLHSKTPVLVDLWAQWCGPCRALAPIVEQVAERYGGTAQVFKLNVDQNPVLTARYAVQGIPTLILFRDGVEKERIVGVVNQQKLSSSIERHVNAASN